MRYQQVLPAGCALAAWSMSGAALAQSEQPATTGATLEEIVVTVQRTSENLQDVPIVVNVVTEEAAQQRGIYGLTDLPSLVPGLLFNTSTNAGLVFLRGVGIGTGAAGAEGPIAFYLDDVYIASVSSNMSELNSVNRVEVLSGPQGTLFGRNALGGVIHVITKDPVSEPQLDASLTYGNYDTVRAQAYASTAIASDVSADVAILYRDQNDGWGRNLARGEDVFASSGTSIRSKLLWEPGEDTRLTVSVFYDDSESQVGLAARLLPGSIGRDGSTAPANFYDVNQNVRSSYDTEAWITSANLVHDFGWGVAKNILAYQQNESLFHHDSDNTPGQFSLQDPVSVFSSTWTEELQLTSPETSSVDWIAGAFYLRNSSGYDIVRVLLAPPNAMLGNYFDIVSKMITDSYAIYGQTAFDLFPQARFTLGARYTYDRKHVYGQNTAELGSVFGAGDQEDSWDEFTYRAAFDYKFSEDFLGYVSYSRGFKAGYFNTAAPADPSVSPETIDAVEVGFKSDLLQRRLRLNAAAFHYDYQNMQLRSVSPVGVIRLLNAAESRIRGVDVSFEAIATERLRFDGAIEWLDSEFTDFRGAPATRPNPAGGNVTVITDFTGRSLFLAPKLTATIGAQYTQPLGSGQLLWAANYQYNDGFSWSPEVDDRTREEGYSVVNLSVQYTPPSEGWAIRLWGKNISDTKYNGFVNTTTAGGDYGTPAAPATFGITVDLHL